MGMILSFCFLVGFRNQTVHLGGLFSDINGESLPNEPSNTWPKEKKHHVTVTIPKQKFAADARTLDQATWNQTVLGLLLTWYADPFRI